MEWDKGICNRRKCRKLHTQTYAYIHISRRYIEKVIYFIHAPISRSIHFKLHNSFLKLGRLYFAASLGQVTQTLTKKSFQIKFNSRDTAKILLKTHKSKK